jgi:hypothetical protein
MHSRAAARPAANSILRFVAASFIALLSASESRGIGEVTSRQAALHERGNISSKATVIQRSRIAESLTSLIMGSF